MYLYPRCIMNSKNFKHGKLLAISTWDKDIKSMLLFHLTIHKGMKISWCSGKLKRRNKTVEILITISCNETLELFPKGRSGIYLDTKSVDFYIYIFPIIITAKPIEILSAISRNIRKCLHPVMPLCSPVPTSEGFHTDPWGKEKVEEDVSLFWWNLEVAFMIKFTLF